MKTLTLSLVVLGIIITFGAQAEDTRSYINARSASDKEALPFSGAVLAGDTLYLSGSLGSEQRWQDSR